MGSRQTHPLNVGMYLLCFIHTACNMHVHTATLRPPRLGSEERRRQKAHLPIAARYAYRCAVAPHGGDALRRLEARHGSCCPTVLRALLLLCDCVDHERVAAFYSENVQVARVLVGRTLNKDKVTALELAEESARRNVPYAHLRSKPRTLRVGG